MVKKEEKLYKLPFLKWKFTFKQILITIGIIGVIIFFIFCLSFSITTDYFSCGSTPIKTEIKVIK